MSYTRRAFFSSYRGRTNGYNKTIEAENMARKTLCEQRSRWIGDLLNLSKAHNKKKKPIIKKKAVEWLCLIETPAGGAGSGFQAGLLWPENQWHLSVFPSFFLTLEHTRQQNSRVPCQTKDPLDHMTTTPPPHSPPPPPELSKSWCQTVEWIPPLWECELRGNSGCLKEEGREGQR